MKTAAIILAAGQSARLGQPKQLVMFQGETLLARGIRMAREAGCEPIVVVLGAHSTLIEAQVSLDGVHVVHNRHWQEGMASSLRAAVAELALGKAEAAVVLACDQPAVTPTHLLALIDLSGSGRIASSSYAGRRGIPAVFPRDRFHDLLRLSGDAGARHLLQLEETAALELPYGEIDIDTPEDLAALGDFA